MDQEVFDILSNDVKIVDLTTRTDSGRQGAHTLRFPGKYMPDGRDFLGEVPEKLDPSILKEWCNAVRREVDARQRSKELAKAHDEPAGGTDRTGTGGGSTDSVPTGVNAPPAGKASEASLEVTLQAEVARWARAARDAEQEEARLATLASQCADVLADARRHHARAVAVLEFYLTTKEPVDNDDPSTW